MKTKIDVTERSYLPTYQPKAGERSENPMVRVLPEKYLESQHTAARNDMINFDWTGAPDIFPVAPLRDWFKIISKSQTSATMEFLPAQHALIVRDNDPVTPGTAKFLGMGCYAILEDDNNHPMYGNEVTRLPLGYILTLTCEVPQEDQKPNSWLVKAAKVPDKFNTLPELCKVYGNIASDGYRLHYDPSLPEIPAPDRLSRLFNTTIEPCHHYQDMATVNTKNLMKAIKGVKKFTSKDHFYMSMSVNGQVECCVNNKDKGTITLQVEGEFTHSGKDFKVDIRPEFMIDALSGMGDTVIIASKPNKYPTTTGVHTHPLYITDGTREAAIAPVNPEAQ